ncbi:hypothetical protein BN1183_CU_00100 [Pantoea ananatis]|nr:hypothetical protein BN1183_CU_00100 [Pantoea ananatis]
MIRQRIRKQKNKARLKRFGMKVMRRIHCPKSMKFLAVACTGF